MVIIRHLGCLYGDTVPLIRRLSLGMDRPLANHYLWETKSLGTNVHANNSGKGIGVITVIDQVGTFELATTITISYLQPAKSCSYHGQGGMHCPHTVS